MNIKKNFSLKKYNSFGIDIKTKYFVSLKCEQDVNAIISNKKYKKEKKMIIGGGSNILFTDDYKGMILLNCIKGINVLSDNRNNITIEVGAGEVWHNLVVWSIKNNLSGIENLALIPGLVGASPIQNIGAYGVEVKNVIKSVHYIEIKTGQKKIIHNNECNFKYRDSIFKNKLKDKVIITKVVYTLSKIANNNIQYGAIQKELKKIKKDPSPKNIAEAVTNIRNRKLPNPKILANCGSFFKNPKIETTQFEKLKKIFPNIVGYKISDKEIKIAAGWLIENAGLKGYRIGDAGIHKNQALVLVNYGKATGNEILSLANMIKEKIKRMYGIVLENEVTIL